MTNKSISSARRSSRFFMLFSGLVIVGILFIFSVNILMAAVEPFAAVEEKTDEETSQTEFVARIHPYASELQAAYGVLPSIIIGQAILESNWGQSTLADEYNNLFGIKAYGDERKVNLETKEYVNEEWVTIQGDFKVYDTWEESMNDHTKLFVEGVTWNPRLYEQVLLAKNYKEAARALQAAGYATDPQYAEKVIHVIETYELYQYDE